jgi:arabinose-5-phosphate isomerase
MKNGILETALQTIQLESKSIADLSTFLDESFIRAIEALNNCKGRLIFSGIGKSALIAQKIVATPIPQVISERLLLVWPSRSAAKK